MTHFNQLTPAEAERLALLLEELGEAQQVVGKILRHGYESYNPNIPNSPTNRKMLEKELGDVFYAMCLMGHSKDINHESVLTQAVVKGSKVFQWLHHNEPVCFNFKQFL